MAEEAIDPVLLPAIQETQQLLGALVTKPKLADKYLAKPPFRFLIDVVKACVDQYGYPAGLLSPDLISKAESKDAAVATREVKISVLERVIHCVAFTVERAPVADPMKILKGIDAINTNAFLCDLARAIKIVQSGQKSMPDLVSRVDAGDTNWTAASTAPPAAVIQHIEPPQPIIEAAPIQHAPVPISRPEPVHVEQPVAQPVFQAPAAVEAPPPAAPAAAALAFDNTPDAPEWIDATQQMLQPLFEKPRLVQKHLSKPPFGFLHDIIRAVMASTGFFEGLFSEAELDRASLTDAKQKAAFLKCAIETIGVANGQPTVVNIGKILAGAEPEATNQMLQDLARAARSHGANFADVLARIHRQDSEPAAAAPAPVAPPAPVVESAPQPTYQPTPAPAPAPVPAPVSNHTSSHTSHSAAPSTSRRSDPEAAPATARQLHKQQQLEQQQQQQQQAEPSPTAARSTESSAPSADADHGTTNKFERPRTARRPPPKVKSNLVDEKPAPVSSASNLGETRHGLDQTQTVVAPVMAAAGVILDSEGGKDDDEDEEVRADDEVENGGAFGDGQFGGGEEGGKVMRDIMKAMADAKKGGKNKEPPRPSSSLDQNGGITFANKLGGGKTDKAGLKAEQRRLNEQLREWVQQLCQSANPLGKCIDFVHEDMEMMNRELGRWQREHASQAERLAEEHRKTVEVILPLQKQLADLEASIAEQQRLIYAATATILQNETSIKQVLDASLQAQR